MSGLTLDDVHAAARRLLNRITRTPVITSQSWDDASGFSVFFKCENLQRAGSFKIRGALNKLLTLSADERRRGVVAFSSGNHAQGVALAARLVGTTAVVCMPKDAPLLKVQATRGYGAEIVVYDRHTEDREAIARRIASETGRVVVPPFDDEAIMAGQGTAALEFLQDVPSLDALVAPVGGGGLMAGCGIQKGERVSIPPPPTIADGVRLTTPGELTFPILQQTLSDVALVTDDEIRAALRYLVLRAHVVVEPTGAVAAAAVLSGKVPLERGARVGVILSGGNIDPPLLSEILETT